MGTVELSELWEAETDVELHKKEFKLSEGVVHRFVNEVWRFRMGPKVKDRKAGWAWWVQKDDEAGAWEQIGVVPESKLYTLEHCLKDMERYIRRETR